MASSPNPPRNRPKTRNPCQINRVRNEIPPPFQQVGRNSPCPCGSGKKYKRCCGVSAPPILCAA